MPPKSSNRTHRRPLSDESPVLIIVFIVVGLLGATGIVLQLNRISVKMSAPTVAKSAGAVAGAHEEVTTPVVVSDAPLRNSDVPDFSMLMTARAAAVIDARSGTKLFEKNPGLVLPVASLTKLATAAVVLESGVDLEGTVSLESSDLTENGTGAEQFSAGEQVRRKDLFFAALIGSSNPAATALARSSGLTREEFIAGMNDLAASLGLTNTHFSDPTGLDPKNVSTATEFSYLAEYAFRSSLIREATTTTQVEFRDRTGRFFHRFFNTDKLLNDGIRVSGGKTGSLNEARYSFAALITDEAGHEITEVVLGAASDERRFSEAKALALWAFSAYAWEGR